MRNLNPRFLSQSIFQIAENNQLLDELFNSFNLFNDLVKKNYLLRFFIQSKKITNGEKFSVLNQTLSTSVHPLILELVSHLKGTLALKIFSEVFDDFSRKYKNRKNIVSVKAILSEKLSDKQKHALKDSIDKIIKKDSDISVFIDKSIIGGIKLKINNVFLDASIQNQLQKLKNRLLLS